MWCFPWKFLSSTELHPQPPNPIPCCGGHLTWHQEEKIPAPIQIYFKIMVGGYVLGKALEAKLPQLFYSLFLLCNPFFCLINIILYTLLMFYSLYMSFKANESTISIWIRITTRIFMYIRSAAITSNWFLYLK